MAATSLSEPFKEIRMIEDLNGKIVLITGAGTGIGASAARVFGQNHCKVVVHYNKSAALAQVVVADIRKSGGDAIAVQADVMDTAAIKALVEKTVAHFGRIDILVNNAGDMVKRVSISEVSDDFFDRVVYLNVRSMIAACREAVPYMRKQGGGNIINVTSIAARHGGGSGAVMYAAAKGFVSTATRGLAKELVKDNIRVNAVSPGVVMTPFHGRHSSDQQLEGFRAGIPMQRLGTPDECAGAFLYLASDRMSSYVTGQIIEVNGGQLMP
jgi:3-oxoacyl-[acyl-carrier protein] reductase